MNSCPCLFLTLAPCPHPQLRKGGGPLPNCLGLIPPGIVSSLCHSGVNETKNVINVLSSATLPTISCQEARARRFCDTEHNSVFDIHTNCEPCEPSGYCAQGIALSCLYCDLFRHLLTTSIFIWLRNPLRNISYEFFVYFRLNSKVFLLLFGSTISRMFYKKNMHLSHHLLNQGPIFFSGFYFSALNCYTGTGKDLDRIK